MNWIKDHKLMVALAALVVIAGGYFIYTKYFAETSGKEVDLSNSTPQVVDKQSETADK